MIYLPIHLLTEKKTLLSSIEMGACLGLLLCYWKYMQTVYNGGEKWKRQQ